MLGTTDNADVLFDEDQASRIRKLRDGSIKNDGMQAPKVHKASGGGFGAFNLSEPVYGAIKAKGYNLPTPIQRRAIP